MCPVSSRSRSIGSGTTARPGSTSTTFEVTGATVNAVSAASSSCGNTWFTAVKTPPSVYASMSALSCAAAARAAASDPVCAQQGEVLVVHELVPLRDQEEGLRGVDLVALLRL